jgi:hypothetical protein
VPEVAPAVIEAALHKVAEALELERVLSNADERQHLARPIDATTWADYRDMVQSFRSLAALAAQSMFDVLVGRPTLPL